MAERPAGSPARRSGRITRRADRLREAGAGLSGRNRRARREPSALIKAGGPSPRPISGATELSRKPSIFVSLRNVIPKLGKHNAEANGVDAKRAQLDGQRSGERLDSTPYAGCNSNSLLWTSSGNAGSQRDRTTPSDVPTSIFGSNWPGCFNDLRL